MPYVKRIRDEERLVPDWLRKVFGLPARPPVVRAPIVMPAPVKIPQPRAFQAQGELTSLAAPPKCPGELLPAIALEAQGDITVRKPLVLKRNGP